MLIVDILSDILLCFEGYDDEMIYAIVYGLVLFYDNFESAGNLWINESKVQKLTKVHNLTSHVKKKVDN